MYGKDVRPEETIRKITGILKRAGLSVEEVSWKHPAAHVWSVHIREAHCHLLTVNGKGTTKALALASALGEFMERLITGYFFSDFTLYGIISQKKFIFSPDEKWFTPKKALLSKGILTSQLRDLYDPDGELRPQDAEDRMSSPRGKKAICALPFQKTRDGEVVYFPVNILDNLYASNGMAAGNTREEACVQALSEVLERYVKNTIIRKGIALPNVPKNYYSQFRNVTGAIAALEGAGFRVLVKDASLGGRYPVVNVTIVERKTKKCFLAFGAHPSFEIALTRTVTELLQGQKIAAFQGLKRTSKNEKEVRNRSNLVSHFINSSGIVSEGFFREKPVYCSDPVDFKGTRKEEEMFLLAVFRKAKKDVYVNALSIDGFYVCRIVVPGWSEIYPVEDLVYGNNNRARGLVDNVFKLPTCTRAQLREVLSFIDAGTVGEQEIAADVLGIVLDAGSPWKRLCFGELKLLVLLALKERAAAKTQLAWCVDVGCSREEMNDVYECLGCLLAAKGTDGFGRSVLSRARKLFSGMDAFRDLFLSGGAMRGTRTHKKMLNVFMRSRKIL